MTKLGQGSDKLWQNALKSKGLKIICTEIEHIKCTFEDSATKNKKRVTIDGNAYANATSCYLGSIT